MVQARNNLENQRLLAGGPSGLLTWSFAPLGAQAITSGPLKVRSNENSVFFLKIDFFFENGHFLKMGPSFENGSLF